MPFLMHFSPSYLSFRNNLWLFQSECFLREMPVNRDQVLTTVISGRWALE